LLKQVFFRMDRVLYDHCPRRRSVGGVHLCWILWRSAFFVLEANTPVTETSGLTLGRVVLLPLNKKVRIFAHAVPNLTKALFAG
jgi:hypothetical protein